MTRATCAGHTIGMPDGDCATIDVDLLRIDAELIPAVDRLCRKGLVEIPDIKIINSKSVAFKKPRHGEHRSNAHFIRIATARGKSAERTERLETTFLSVGFAHDDA